MPEGERRLAAILFTDMVGFTALTQSDEAQSLQVLDRHNRLLAPFFPKFHGRQVKAMGDSFLVEFDNALDAVNCAFAVQTFLHDYNISSRDEWKITLRAGIHLGDVVHREGDVFGDTVNVASRLHPLCEPEGVCVSEQVYHQVRNKVPHSFVKLEPRDLKGVKFGVEVYRAVMPWERRGGSEAAVAPSSPLERSRIAVLPFTNMSSDPEEGYFSDGMTEEIITSLSRVKELAVIARTSVMGYKGTTKKVREIGAELGAGSILEGSVRKAGDRVRITAQLVASATESHLWAEKYDRTLDDVFAIQSDIAEKVARELRVLLVDSEKRAIEKRPTENIEAYSDYLRGRELLREGSEAPVRKALALFEKAIELDPSFAGAYAGRALCHQVLANGGHETWEVMIPTVKEALKRALELDPGLAEAHAARAVLLYNEDDAVGGQEEARRAIELNPSLPGPYTVLFSAAMDRGEPEEALGYAETAYRLDPIAPRVFSMVGTAYYYTGREREALDLWRKTEHIAPFNTYFSLAEYHLGRGETAEAAGCLAKLKEIRPTDPLVTALAGGIAGRTGDREGALASIRELEDANLGAVGLNWIGFTYFLLGDLDTYFEYMNRALEAHAIQGVTFMYSPVFAGAKADPRYAELVRKLRAQSGQTKQTA